MESKTNLVELDKLVGLFHSDVAELGVFTPVAATDIPEPAQSMLNHDFHMTVTVEKFHSSPVYLVVLQDSVDCDTYSREICLHNESDGAVVQYGIVRLHFKHLDKMVQDEVQSQKKPLGRILIDHNVLRRVQLLSLYEIKPTQSLAIALDCSPDATCYGRTAIIYCNDEPAIELLEVVAT